MDWVSRMLQACPTCTSIGVLPLSQKIIPLIDPWSIVEEPTKVGNEQSPWIKTVCKTHGKFQEVINEWAAVVRIQDEAA